MKNNNTLKQWLLISTYVCLLIVGVMNFSSIYKFLKNVMLLLSPLFYGLIFAFIFNLLMTNIENFIKNKMKKQGKWVRPVSLGLTILFVICILVLISYIIFPQLFDSIVLLGNNINKYSSNIIELINDVLAKLNIDFHIEISDIFSGSMADIGQKLLQFVQDAIPDVMNHTINATMDIAVQAGYFIMGIMMSIYFVNKKEAYQRQCIKICVAYLPKKVYERLFYVMSKSNQVFTSFVSGQLTEAVILGLLFYVVMSLCQMPYALLISTIIAVLSIIPMFGAMLGQFFGFVLILAINPLQSIIFIVVFQLVQQFEGNVIYPKVVGNSVGLPGVWVLLSIVVFGGVFGLFGVVIAVPATAVMYSLFGEDIRKRLRGKNVKVEYNTITYDKTND